MLPPDVGIWYPCVWKQNTVRTSPRHPLLLLSFLCHLYILTIFLENFYPFLVYVYTYADICRMCIRRCVQKSPCITCHMTMKYIMMYPSMVGSVQCDVPTKGCLLCVCVCVSTSKLVTVRGYCSLLVLCLFSSTWCTPHKQGPSGAHKEDMVCRVFHCSQPQCGTLVHLD